MINTIRLGLFSKAEKRPRSETFFLNSVKISYSEILAELGKIRKNCTSNQFINLLKVITNDSTWMGRTFMQMSKEKVFDTPSSGETEEWERDILNAVAKKQTIYGHTQQDIFKTIFSEVERAQHDTNYKPIVTCPPIKATIVLISGVLNEIFSTAAFERGAQHLAKQQGLKYFVPKVDGLKDPKTNAKLIKTAIT